MFEFVSQSNVTNLVTELGDVGIFIAMFLESSIVPIPSEVIVIGAGALGFPLTSIIIFGALGSTFGAMVGYALGRYAAMPMILKFGRFILIKPHHIEKAEKFAKKYGVASVLIGRIIPVIPFKVFSISAGVTRIPFIPFTVCTLVGVLPRIFILSLFGSAIIKYKMPAFLAVIFCATVFFIYKLIQQQNKQQPEEKNV
jgi:membrane protein DedA with SNARE-associated domain